MQILVRASGHSCCRAKFPVILPDASDKISYDCIFPRSSRHEIGFQTRPHLPRTGRRPGLRSLRARRPTRFRGSALCRFSQAVSAETRPHPLLRLTGRGGKHSCAVSRAAASFAVDVRGREQRVMVVRPGMAQSLPGAPGPPCWLRMLPARAFPAASRPARPTRGQAASSLEWSVFP